MFFKEVSSAFIWAKLQQKVTFWNVFLLFNSIWYSILFLASLLQ